MRERSERACESNSPNSDQFHIMKTTFYYTYVLLSLKDKKFYIGYTANLNKRIQKHMKGKVQTTKYRLPIKLVYYEACLTKENAIRREKQIKSYKGGNAFKKLIDGV